MNQQKLKEDLYRDVSFQMRAILIATVNIIIGILIAYVFPLERFGIFDDTTGKYVSILNIISSSQVILIILSITLGSLLNYYFIYVAKDLSEKAIIILHGIILINLILASIIVNIIYLSIFLTLVYLLLTFIVIRIREDIYQYFIVRAIFLVYISQIFVWYFKTSVMIDISEILGTQIILGIVVLLSKKSDYKEIMMLLPMILNIILLPFITNIYVYGDINLIVFASFILMNLVYASINNHIDTIRTSVISVSVLFSLRNVVLQLFIQEKLFKFQIGDIILNTNSMIYLLILIVFTIIMIKNIDDFSVTNPTMLSILLVSIYFNINTNTRNYIATPPVTQLFLSLGYLLPSLFLLNSSFRNSIPDEYASIIKISGLQIWGMLLLSFIPNVIYSPSIQNFTFISFVLITIVTRFNHLDLSNILSLNIGVLIVLNAIINNNNQFNPINPILLAISVNILGIFLFRMVDTNQIRNILLTQFISMYFISFAEYADINGFSIIDLGLLVYAIELIVLFYFNRNDVNIHLFSVITSVGLSILYIITDYSVSDYTPPHPYTLSILLVVPSVLLFMAKYSGNKMYMIGIHSIGIAFYTSVAEYSIISINILSYLYSIYVMIGIVSWYRMRDGGVLISLTVSSSLLQLIFISYDYIYPAIIISGILTLVLSSTIFLTDDNNDITAVVISQAFSILLLGFYKLDKLTSITMDLFAKIDIAGMSFTPIATIFFVGYFLIVISVWFGSENTESFIPLSAILLILLYITIALLPLNISFMVIPPIILSIAIITIIFGLLKRKERYTDVIIALSFIAIFLMSFQSNQISIKIGHISFGIVSVVYIFYSMLMIRYLRQNEELGFISPFVFGSFNLIISLFSNSHITTTIPYEFIVIVVLISAIIPLRSEIDKNIRYSIFGQGIIVITLLLKENYLSLFIEINIYTNTILFMGYCLSTLYLISKSSLFENWIVSMFIYLLVITTVSVKVGIIHPITIGLSILILSVLTYKTSFHQSRLIIPAVQSFGMILLLINDTLTLSILSYTSIFTLLWVIIMLLIWYLNGTSKQLISIYASVYVLIALFSIITLLGSKTVVNEYVMIAILLITTAFSIRFYSSIALVNSKILFKLLILSEITLIFFSKRLDMLISNILILKLIVDWFIFLPLLVESSIYMKRYIDMQLSDKDRIEKSDIQIISIQISFVITALFMGANGIYSLKLLSVAITFWIFATMFIHKSLSWATSINTLFTLAYILAQIPSSGNNTEIFYFLLLSGLGIVMISLAIVNEIKFSGEPFTSSMIMTGGVFTALTIIAPLLRGNSFPISIIDQQTGDQIIYFLPNILWALQGLVLFLFSLKYNKDYLRKFSLSILLIDILKTGFDILNQNNEFIRIIGSLVLGAVLILIFYLFTNEDKIENEIE